MQGLEQSGDYKLVDTWGISQDNSHSSCLSEMSCMVLSTAHQKSDIENGAVLRFAVLRDAHN